MKMFHDLHLWVYNDLINGSPAISGPFFYPDLFPFSHSSQGIRGFFGLWPPIAF